MKNRNLTIDAVRGIAIILVVYGHIIQRSMVVRGEDFYLNPVFKIIYTFHLPLFVFISGYLMALSLSRKSVGDVFKSRWKSLFVPYIAWGILDVITNYFLKIIEGKNTGSPNFLWGFVDQLLLHPSVWFLFTLFILSCLLLFSVKCDQRCGPLIFGIIYLFILILPYNNYCSLYYIKWFYLFYVIGYCINRYDIKIKNNFMRTIVFLFSLIIFAVLVRYWNKGDYIYLNKMGFASNQYAHEILRIIYRYITGFLGIIIVFYTGSYLSKIKIGSFLDYIGIYSLDIYLIQRYLLEGLYPRLGIATHTNFDFNSPFFLCLYTPLATIFFVGGCLVISKLLFRRNYLLNRLLLGARE